MSKLASASAAFKVALLLVAVCISNPVASVKAHGPHHGGFGNCGSIGWGGGWGGYGMGGGYHYSGYSLFGSSYPISGCSNFGYSGFGFGFPYTSYSNCYNSYSNYYTGFGGIGYSPFRCQSVAFRPVVYSPVYCPPIHYYPAPVVHRPIILETAVPLCVAKTPTVVAKVAYTASTSWTKEAIDLIDAMAQRGGSVEGYAAGKQLIETHKALPGHFYTRMAVLSALNNYDSNEVLDYLALAKKNMADANGQDLPGESLRAYVATLPNASMDSLLNRIAAKALTKPEDRKPEFQVLANLLVIDGQADRASRFTNAIQAPENVPAIDKADVQNLALGK